MRHMKALSVSLLLALGIFAPRAHAATATGNLTVTANVGQTCTVASTVAVNFGTYVGTQLDSTGLLNINCGTGTVTMITLGQGANPSGTSTDAAPDRQMASGANVLGYALYQDAARTVVWGNTTGPTGTGLPYTGTGATDAITVYGRIPTGTAPGNGVYSDTVVVTVNY